MFLGVADPAVALAEGVDRAAIPVPEGLGHVAAVEIGRADRLDRRPPGDAARRSAAGPSGRTARRARPRHRAADRPRRASD